MKIIKGDLISLALAGEFDVIAHGCNCMSTQASGIAKQMVANFQTNNHTLYPLENPLLKGHINKLGQIQFAERAPGVIVVNMYTQYRYGRNYTDGQYKPIDYEALKLCCKKLNHIFAGQKVGLPWIGTGLAGGDKSIVEQIFKDTLTDVDLTIVEYEKV